MEPEVSLPYSKDIAIGSYPEPDESNFSDQIFVRTSYLHMRATWPAHLIVLDFIILIIFGEAHKLWSFPIVLSSPASNTSSSLVPNITLTTVFSTVSIYVRPYVWDTKLRTHIKQREVTVLYILIFKVLDKRREDNRLWTEC